MVSYKRVEEMLQEEIVKAREAEIPIADNIDPHISFPKMQSVYGQCCLTKYKHPDYKKHLGYKFYIRISEYFLAASEDEIRQTLMHELIHTVESTHGHDKEWRKWANVANEKYGYSIARIGDYHDFSLRKQAKKMGVASERAYKYEVYCPTCGKTWKMTRRTNTTMHPEDYYCMKCKTALKCREL